jgi:DNA-directed RNA polymerase specialized sigma24 family protein
VDELDLADRFERQRSQLRAVAYRILGSLGEADDAVQEAWLRVHRTDAEQIDSLERWLTTVVAMAARRFAPYVRPALVNGTAGAVAFDGERPFAVLAFTVINDHAVAIDVFNDPDLVAKLDIRGITA